MKKFKSSINITAKTNGPLGSMTIYSPTRLIFSRNLVAPLGIDPAIDLFTPIKRLTSPSTYFVHCDLLDKDQNLLNGKALTVLARFDIRRKPFERVNYQQHNNMFCAMHRLVIMKNSLTICSRRKK